MTDETGKENTVVRWPLAGYRKFLSPEELKAIRDGKTPRADVIELKRKDPRPPDNG
jgi:hypothetical protein